MTPCNGIEVWGPPSSSPSLPPFPCAGTPLRGAHRFLRSRSILMSARVKVVSACWFSMMLESKGGGSG